MKRRFGDSYRHLPGSRQERDEPACEQQFLLLLSRSALALQQPPAQHPAGQPPPAHSGQHAPLLVEAVARALVDEAHERSPPTLAPRAPDRHAQTEQSHSPLPLQGQPSQHPPLPASARRAEGRAPVAAPPDTHEPMRGDRACPAPNDVIKNRMKGTIESISICWIPLEYAQHGVFNPRGYRPRSAWRAHLLRHPWFSTNQRYFTPRGEEYAFVGSAVVARTERGRGDPAEVSPPRTISQCLLSIMLCD